MTRPQPPTIPAPAADVLLPSLQERFAPAGRCFGCGPANPIAAGAIDHLQLNSGPSKWDPGSTKRFCIASPGALASIAGGQRICCNAGMNVAGSIALSAKLPATGRLP